MIKPLLPHLSEFVELGELKYDKGYSHQSSVNKPFIVGKVVIVDLYKDDPPDSPRRAVKSSNFSAKCGMKWTKQFNYHEFGRLPDDLRAMTPEEVGTIIWLRWDSKEVGHYGKAEYYMPAYRIKCRMKIIDKKRNFIVAEKEFLGEPPPKSTPASFDFQGTYGNKPSAQIIEYIKSLPRKPM